MRFSVSVLSFCSYICKICKAYTVLPTFLSLYMYLPPFFLSLSTPPPPSHSPTQSMFSPASTPYQKLAEECVKYGVGVELFLFPTNYCDVATLGDFVSTTGGELHYYRGYQVRQKINTIQGLIFCVVEPL